LEQRSVFRRPRADLVLQVLQLVLHVLPVLPLLIQVVFQRLMDSQNNKV
jgi:hypothetical protein